MLYVFNRQSFNTQLQYVLIASAGTRCVAFQAGNNEAILAARKIINVKPRYIGPGKNGYKIELEPKLSSPLANVERSIPLVL